MDLNTKLKPIITAGKQRLMAFVTNLEAQVETNLSQIQSMIPVVNILAAKAGADLVESSAESANYIKQVITEEIDDIASRTFSGNTDAGNAFTIQIVRTAVDGVTVDLKSIDIASDAVNFVNNILTIEANDIVSFTPLETKFPINDEMVSLQDVIGMMQNSTTGMQIMSVASRLYSEGQLNAANLVARLNSTLDVVADNFKEFINIIISNLSFMSASYDNFIEFAKSIMSKIRSITTADGKFKYGVDNYDVNTSVFIGVDVVIDIATTIIGAVSYIFAPIIGVAVNLIGHAASQITHAIRENSSQTPVFLEDPSFVGYGQNSARLYVYDKANILYDAFVRKGAGIVTVQTPLTTAIIYNQPKKNALHQDVYPCQEFIIPFIPLDSQIPLRAFNLIANGNRMTYSESSTVDEAGDAFYTGSINVSGTAMSSQDKRFSVYLDLLQYINDHPNSIHVIDSSDSNDIALFGTWYATLLYMYAVRGIDAEYNNLKKQFSIMEAINLLSSRVNTIQDMMTADKLAAFSVLNRSYYVIISNRPYDPDSTISAGNWFANLMTGYYNNGIYYSPITGLSIYLLKWSTITNIYLGTDPGYGSLLSELDATNISSTPLDIVSMDLSDKLNPYMLPPQSEINIWARVAVTVGTIAVTVAAVAATKAVVRRRAQRSFYTNALTTKKYFDQWLVNPTKDNWKIYIRSNTKTNLIGKVFRVGSFDAANNWINNPASSDGGIFKMLQELAGGDYSIKDVINLIKPI